MNILITGCAGFIGFHLANTLCNKHSDSTIFGIDNLNNYYDISLKQHRLNILKQNINFNFRNLDLNEINLIEQDFDLAINLAAQASTRLSSEHNHLYEHSNINGFNSFLNFCNSMKIEKIIYASSSSVYSGMSQMPFKENTILGKPANKYAETKIYNEKLALHNSKKFNRKSIGLRFFTVYGSYGRPDMAYYSFTKDILNKNPINLFNNGNLYRDMTHISDIIEGTVASIGFFKKMKNSHEIFNLGNNYPVQTKELLGIIESELKMKADIKIHKKEEEVFMTHADINKAKTMLSYMPKIGLNEGMNDFFGWFKSYYNI